MLIDMLDILLIYPPLSINERYGKRRLGRVGGNLPPLGLAYIASFLREHKFNVDIIDGPTSEMTEEEILKKIKLLQPKVIGLSAMTSVFKRAAELARKIRSKFPDTLIIIGGHHASILPIESLSDNPSFDILVYGEGEHTLLEVMHKFRDTDFNRHKFLNDYAILEGIKGITFRKINQIKQTFPREAIEDLDVLPPPAWDILPMHKYIPLPNQYLRRPVVHMVSTRGCPFECSFCSAGCVFGTKIRALSPVRLVDVIKYAKERFGAREISFWDDCMSVNKKWIIELCQLMVEEKLNVTWSCYSRVDTLNRDILLLMKKAGCWNIFYGFESGNQELLDITGKRITLEQIRQVNQWTKEAGIEVRASFMIALPGETPEMAQKTIDFAIALEPDYAQFCITTPFPKTKLYEEAQRYGRISADFSRYNIWEAVFIPYGYRNKAQIEAMERMAVHKFYLRPRYIWGRIRKIRSFTDVIRYLKGLRMLIGFIQ
ncbi:MAG: cobalamin B12-binding domain-containing protein [Candidatus Omnitrophica bacterium]|nr:cobalamin B12-binding domain-containing protein [Candidatus Omnitrophota bacterium]